MSTIGKKWHFSISDFERTSVPHKDFNRMTLKRPLTPQMEAQPIRKKQNSNGPIRNKHNSNGPIRERHSTPVSTYPPSLHSHALRKHEMTHLHAMIRTHGMKVHSIRPLPPARSQKFHMTHLHAIIRTHQLPTLTLLPRITKIRNLHSPTH